MLTLVPGKLYKLLGGKVCHSTQVLQNQPTPYVVWPIGALFVIGSASWVPVEALHDVRGLPMLEWECHVCSIYGIGWMYFDDSQAQVAAP